MHLSVAERLLKQLLLVLLMAHTLCQNLLLLLLILNGTVTLAILVIKEHLRLGIGVSIYRVELLVRATMRV